MNLDKLKNFPNQNTDGDPNSCVALTVADICGNIDGELYDPDLIYADALKIMNKAPNTAGLDPLAGMQAAVIYGCLPLTQDSFDAKTMGELYIANWQNYPLYERQAAQQHVQRGVKGLYSFQSIRRHLLETETGASLSMKWYQSFAHPQNGILPAPRGNFSFHDVAVYDATPEALMIKPWLGADYGDGGYTWLSWEFFDQVYEVAYGFDPNGWRWLNLATYACVKPWLIPDVLPLLRT